MPFIPPEVATWMGENLDTEINVKARTAAIYLVTTTKAIQDRIINNFYCNQDGQYHQDRLARAVIEKVVKLEAKEGHPLFLFTGETLLNAEPNKYKAQQYFP